MYDAADPKSRLLWYQTFDKKLNLPRRADVYQARFDMPWTNNIFAFKTDHERDIEIGREYEEKAIDFG